MKRVLMLAGPVMAIISAIAAMAGLGLGGTVPRWVMFIWPAVVIVWSLVVLIERRTGQLNRKTIDWQAGVIRNQAELLGRILMQDIDGRE